MCGRGRALAVALLAAVCLRHAAAATEATVSEDFVGAACCMHGSSCGEGQLCLYNSSMGGAHLLFFDQACPEASKCFCVWWRPSAAETTTYAEGAYGEVAQWQTTTSRPLGKASSGEYPAKDEAFGTTTTTATATDAAVEEGEGFVIKGSFDVVVGKADQFVKDAEVYAAMSKHVAEMAGVPEEFVEIALQMIGDGGRRPNAAGAERRLLGFTVRVGYTLRVPSPEMVKGTVAAAFVGKADDVKRNIQKTSAAALESAIRTSVSQIDSEYEPTVKDKSEPIIFEEEDYQQREAMASSRGGGADLSMFFIVFLIIVGVVILGCLIFGIYQHYAKQADIYNIDPFVHQKDEYIAPVLSFHKKRTKKDKATKTPTMASMPSEAATEADVPGAERGSSAPARIAFEIGETVEVKALPDAEWQTARVVSASPLLVRALSAPEDAPGVTWPFVRPLGRGAGGKKWAAVAADLVASQPSGIIVKPGQRQPSRTGPSGLRSGEKVFVRSHEADPWMPGLVVDSERRLIRLASASEQAMPTAWKYVRRESGDEEGGGEVGRDSSSRRSRGWVGGRSTTESMGSYE